MFSLKKEKKMEPSQQQQPNPPENPEVNLSHEEYSGPSPTSSQTDQPTHFDHLIGGAEAAGPFSAAAAPAAPVFTREEFQGVFTGAFQAGHEYTGLQSLKIEQDREDAAKRCAGALYDTILDIPALHWIISPQNKWWGRIFAIGMFTVPLSKSVIAELQARRGIHSGDLAAGPVREGGPTPEQREAMGAA